MKDPTYPFLRNASIALQFGLRDLKGHDFRDNEINGNCGQRTIQYLKKQISKRKDVSEAFEEIKGLNNGFKIQAIQLGLKIQDLSEHHWENNKLNGYCGMRTIEYLRKQISKGKDVSEAFEKIKGLDSGHKLVVIGFGLEKKDLEDLSGHDWQNTASNCNNGSRTQLYFQLCPREIPLRKAMANLKHNLQHDNRWVHDILTIHNRGHLAFIHSRGHLAFISPEQVYASNITEEQIVRIENGESYAAVVPEGAKFILENPKSVSHYSNVEKRRQQYVTGAASEAISLIMKDIPKAPKNETSRREIYIAPENESFGEKIASYLTPKEGKMLSQVTKETLNVAKYFMKKEKAKQNKEWNDEGPRGKR